MNALGWRCATCGAELGIHSALPWRCPRSTPSDRRHVLHLVRADAPLAATGDPRPLLAFDLELAWAAFADAHGMGAVERAQLVTGLDGRVAGVAGTGFHRTPVHRSAALSDGLGFDAAGGVWVKDETGNVAGSHKARHLVTILLHLLAAEHVGLAPWQRIPDRAPLAISSCGNAALAAATLARAVEWPLQVFVPPWADPTVVAELERLAAVVVTCPRLDGDPPGDPCIHRFREAVATGAVPFSVQGPENALCLDGGRTLGWELAMSVDRPLDRVFVQVGGGAFAACTGAALRSAGHATRLHAVQTAGCAPLARAWERSQALPGGVEAAGAHWDDCMWPWEHEPRSVADGILDDETYDWLGVVAAMDATGGAPVVADEALVVEAHHLAVSATGIPASATGTAGLAGLLAIRHQVGDHERVGIVLSGVAR